MNETMTYTGTLVVTTCWCGIAYAMPKNLHDEAHRSGRETFCPLGHSGVFKNSENERLRAETARLRSALDLERARVQSAEQAATAARAQTAKLKKRVGAGVCAYCHRTFGNVARHMATKHKGTT
jgi:cytochrome c553